MGNENIRGISSWNKNLQFKTSGLLRKQPVMSGYFLLLCSIRKTITILIETGKNDLEE